MNESDDNSHSHVFDFSNPIAERRTRQVMWLTAVMMVVEIAAGTIFNSMALLADGWHMSSHALALGVSAVAYAMARRMANDPRFAFGTWKIEVLGGYTSAVLLMGVAAYMGIESISRLVTPSEIRFDEAIPVAILGAEAERNGARVWRGHPVDLLERFLELCLTEHIATLDQGNDGGRLNSRWDIKAI
jgi:Co/Zn/Cd efflux system component